MTYPLETAPPLTNDRYIETFASFRGKTDEWSMMSCVAGKFISDNDFDKKPVRMPSIGAGTGMFEKDLVERRGLLLEYVYVIEPNSLHRALLDQTLKSLGIPYDIDGSYFGEDFNLKINGKQPSKFDIILLSHVLYGIDHPYQAVFQLQKFLKPGGKVLIFCLEETDAAPELFKYLTENSDPSVFNPQLAIQDHSVTVQKIMSYIQVECPELVVSLMKYTARADVDDFVRRDGSIRNDDVITFFAQAEYSQLSDRAQKEVYDIVLKHCDVVNGKYFIRTYGAAIVISQMGLMSRDIKM